MRGITIHICGGHLEFWRPYWFLGWRPDQKGKLRYQSNIMQSCLLVELSERFDHFWSWNYSLIRWHNGKEGNEQNTENWVETLFSALDIIPVRASFSLQYVSHIYILESYIVLIIRFVLALRHILPVNVNIKILFHVYKPFVSFDIRFHPWVTIRFMQMFVRKLMNSHYIRSHLSHPGCISDLW